MSKYTASTYDELPCELDIENPQLIAFLSLIRYLELDVPTDEKDMNMLPTMPSHLSKDRNQQTIKIY